MVDEEKKAAKKPETSDPVLARAPTVRNFVTWTPTKLRTAELQADSGDLSYAASVCEWLLSDDRISGALDARLDALFGLRPDFEPGVGRRKNQAIKALEAEEDFYQSYPEDQSRLIHGWGLLLGAAPAHHHWEDADDHRNRWLPQPQFWHPQTLRWDWEKAQWTINNFRHERLIVTPGDSNWVLHTPFGKDRPWSRGLWRSLGRWVLLKHYAIQDWARHGEKAAIAVVTAPEGATRQQRQELAQDLKASGDDAVIALAAGFDLKLVEVSANTRQIYQAQIEMADLAIAIRIRGANLSSNVEGGSLAAAEAQFRSNETPKLRFDAESFSTTIHDQSLVWWAQFNFGDPRLAPWPKYPVDPEEDVKAKGESEGQAFKVVAAAEQQGFDVDRDAFLENYGISWAKAGEKPKPVEPKQPGNEGDGQNPPEDPDSNEDDGLDDEGDDAPQARKSWKPSGPFAQAVALASGASAESNQGFIEGQLYADALTENAAKSALKALQDVRSAIQEELDQATGFQDLKDRLAARFEGIDAEGVATLTQQAMVMAHMAGRRAVIQDS